MGLDNGIRIISTKEDIVPERLRDSVDPFEIAYWRKCHGIRSEILHFLSIGRDVLGETTFTLDREDIGNIIELMKLYLNKRYWNDHADSIWDFNTFRPTQAKNIKRLKWLYRYMDKHPDIEVYFYDSY